MRLLRSVLHAAVAAAVIGAGTGCTGISTDTTLDELLAGSGLASVTVGDVLNAIQDFTGNADTLPFGQALTADQEVQLADLRAQLAAGEITVEVYHEEIAAILGVEEVGMPFAAGEGRRFGPHGFPGGPHGFGGVPGGPFSDPLDLTDEQKTQAQDIFDAMRTDIMTLHDTAQADIEALLTAEQLATLDSLDHGFHPHGRAFGSDMVSDRLATLLELTEEQQTAIQGILDQLQTDIEARRTQARDDFRAILTEEQQAVLDELEANRPDFAEVGNIGFGGMGMFHGGSGGFHHPGF